MSIRHVARRVAVSVAATAAAGNVRRDGVLVHACRRFRDPPPARDPRLGAVLVAPCTGGTPFSSGQNINVVIPTNETFSSDDGLNNNTSGINIVECAAPNGVVPRLTSACDGNTIEATASCPTPTVRSAIGGYTVYACRIRFSSARARAVRSVGAPRRQSASST